MGGASSIENALCILKYEHATGNATWTFPIEEACNCGEASELCQIR